LPCPALTISDINTANLALITISQVSCAAQQTTLKMLQYNIDNLIDARICAIRLWKLFLDNLL